MNALRTNPDWKKIVGQNFSPTAFDAYCHTLQWLSWRPSFIVLHNTGMPTLAQRPAGLSLQHIKNLETYYQTTQRWTGGPHLFIDDRQIWVFTPLTVSGVHSPSWNKVALGVELLGNYETESFSTGRGLKVRRNAVAALVSLSAALGLEAATIKLHREDPLTTHACPGKNVRKLELVQEVQDLLVAQHVGEHPMMSGSLKK